MNVAVRSQMSYGEMLACYRVVLYEIVMFVVSWSMACLPLSAVEALGPCRFTIHLSSANLLLMLVKVRVILYACFNRECSLKVQVAILLSQNRGTDTTSSPGQECYQ